MSTDMTDAAIAAGARHHARTAGVLYLAIIALGLFEEMSRETMVVFNDAAATANNIVSHALLYRFGFAAGVVVCILNLPLEVIFYYMFRVVSRSLALFMLLLVVTSTAIQAANLLNHFAPIVLLDGRSYMAAFGPRELHALAYTALRMQSVGYSISLAFFGVHCVVLGYLIFRSTFLPRALGVMLPVAGVCYLANSFANFVSPRVASILFPGILVPAFVAELSLAVWLVLKGVRVEQG